MRRKRSTSSASNSRIFDAPASADAFMTAAALAPSSSLRRRRSSARLSASAVEVPPPRSSRRRLRRASSASAMDLVASPPPSPLPAPRCSRLRLDSAAGVEWRTLLPRSPRRVDALDQLPPHVLRRITYYVSRDVDDGDAQLRALGATSRCLCECTDARLAAFHIAPQPQRALARALRRLSAGLLGALERRHARSTAQAVASLRRRRPQLQRLVVHDATNEVIRALDADSPLIAVDASHATRLTSADGLQCVTARVSLAHSMLLCDVDALARVRWVDLSYCIGVEDVRALGACHTLLLRHTGVNDVSALGNVDTLDLSGTFVEDVGALCRVRRLFLADCPLLNDAAIAPLGTHDELSLALTDVADVAHLGRVRALDVSSTLVRSLRGLAHCQQLSASGCTLLGADGDDADDATAAARVASLDVSHTPLLALPRMPAVRCLDASGCTALPQHALDTLYAPRLRQVTLAMCGALVDVSALRRCTDVDLAECTALVDVSPLCNARRVILTGCTRVTDVRALVAARYLDIRYSGVRRAAALPPQPLRRLLHTLDQDHQTTQ